MYDNNRFNRGYEGYGPSPRRPRRQSTIYLDQKGYELLRKERFNDGIKIRDYDMCVAKCVHKDPKTGEPAYRNMNDGTFRCDICGTSWPVEVVPVELVEESCNNVINSLQQVKTMLDEVDIPKDSFGEIIPMEAVLKVYPKLLNEVLKRFSQSMGEYSSMYRNSRRNDFENLDNFVSSGYGYRGRQPYDDFRYDRQPEEYYGDPRYDRYDRGYDRGYDRPYDNNYGYDRGYDRPYDRPYDTRDRYQGGAQVERPNFGKEVKRDANPFSKSDNQAPSSTATTAEKKNDTTTVSSNWNI